MPSRKAVALLIAWTALAVAVHGYHLGIEDQDVYLAAIKKNLNPALYPHNAAFFMEQMKGTLFDELMAWCVRLTHWPLPGVIFVWHVVSILLLLRGCRQIGRRCFRTLPGQWAGVALVAGLLTIPIAGTALYIVDQYLHPRALAAAAILFAVVAQLDRRWIAAWIWLIAAALMHPLMAAFGASYCVFLAWPGARRGEPARQRRAEAGVLTALVLALPFLAPVKPAWRAATHARSYYFLLQWEWYEWLGIVAPLALVWWFARLARGHGLEVLEHVCRRLFWFGLFQFAVAAALTLPPGLERLAAFQPMRWMHLYYILFFVFAGGLIGELMLRRRVLLWGMVFMPLLAGMYLAQRGLFPASVHVELPGAGTRNAWVEAFDWVRHNTPQDAYFALNPEYMTLRGEDYHGFRALAERSMMAENAKDPGAATVFPDLTEPWYQQVQALRGWEKFRPADFQRLQEQFGVNWVVLEREVAGLECPYHQSGIWVCRLSICRGCAPGVALK